MKMRQLSGVVVLSSLLLGLSLSWAGCDPDPTDDKFPGQEDPTGGEPGGEECITGTLGCLCRPQEQCDEGLQCMNGSCVEAAVEVPGDPLPGEGDPQNDIPQGVRSCEFLIQDTNKKIEKVIFDDQVKGTFQKRGSKIAVVFMSNEDIALNENSLRLEWKPGVDVEQARFSIEKSTCYDRLGRPVEAEINWFD